MATDWSQYAAPTTTPGKTDWSQYAAGTDPSPAQTAPSPTLKVGKPDSDYSEDPEGDVARGLANPGGVGSLARGVVKGVGGLPLLGADVAHGALNLIRKHAFGMTDDEIDKAKGSFLDQMFPTTENINSAMDSLHVPKMAGTAGDVLETAGSIAGGAVAPGTAKPNPSLWTLSPNSPMSKAAIAAPWAEAIGQPGQALTRTTLKAADDAAGTMLDIGRNAKKVAVVDPAIVSSAVNKIATDSGIASGEPHALMRQVTKAFDDTGGGVDTETLGDIASRLGKAGKTAMNSDYTVGSALLDTKNYVEGLISATLSPGEQAAYDKGRSIYKTLWGQLLASPTHVNSETGELNGKAMISFLKRNDPVGFMLNSTNPVYKPLQQLEGTMGSTAGLTGPELAHIRPTLFNVIAKTAQAFPGALQQLMQSNGTTASFLRSMYKKPGFMETLGKAMSGSGEDGDNVPASSSPSP